MRYCFDPIGHLRSPFTDKFGIPRQPRLVPAARAWLDLRPDLAREEALRGLEGYSHLWLLWVFHEDCLEARQRLTVRPPRLGGRASVGVFASRAPYRPNPIGLSAVTLHGWRRDGGQLSLELGGVDLLDGTPVLDIKPYVPYADCIAEARGGFAVAPADLAPPPPVRFAPAALSGIAAADPDGSRDLRALIAQVLAQDPRPGYMDRYPRRQHFALRLFDQEICWRHAAGELVVESVRPSVPPAAP